MATNSAFIEASGYTQEELFDSHITSCDIRICQRKHFVIAVKTLTGRMLGWFGQKPS
jgi:hypothetical protein